MLVHASEQIDSTNAEAIRLVERGHVSGWTLVTAREQTAGRGRRDRAWSSPPGNAYMSFIVPKDRRAEWQRPWLLGLVAALAVHDVVSSILPDDADVRVKWPNDVLIAGAKTSGLLLEARGTVPFLVCGIGINVASHPDGTPYPATHINAHRPDPATADAVVGMTAALLPARVEQWLELGFGDIRAALLARGHRPGEALSVRAEPGAVEGRFRDIDGDGQLVLDTGDGVRRLSSGDVFPGLRP